MVSEGPLRHNNCRTCKQASKLKINVVGKKYIVDVFFNVEKKKEGQQVSEGPGARSARWWRQEQQSNLGM